MLTIWAERQVTELHANSAITHEPATPSQLMRSTSVSEDRAQTTPATVATSTAGTSTEVKNDWVWMANRLGNHWVARIKTVDLALIWISEWSYEVPGQSYMVWSKFGHPARHWCFVGVYEENLHLGKTGASRLHYEETRSGQSAVLSLIPKLSFYIFEIWSFCEWFPLVFNIKPNRLLR